MNLFQLLFVPVMALLAAATLYGTTRGHFSHRQGALWTALWIACAVFIAVPSATTVVASGLGIGRGSDLVFYLAILAGLRACVHFYARCGHLERLVTELARREALGRPEFGSKEKGPQTGAPDGWRTDSRRHPSP